MSVRIFANVRNEVSLPSACWICFSPDRVTVYEALPLPSSAVICTPRGARKAEGRKRGRISFSGRDEVRGRIWGLGRFSIRFFSPRIMVNEKNTATVTCDQARAYPFFSSYVEGCHLAHQKINTQPACKAFDSNGLKVAESQPWSIDVLSKHFFLLSICITSVFLFNKNIKIGRAALSSAQS